MQKLYGLFLLSLFSFLPLSAQVVLPVDFESTTLTYTLTGFEGADSAVEPNPDQTGENTSATVVRTIKTQDAAFFAGTTLELDAAIDFSTNKGISIQTWSPKADIPVRIKLEGDDPTVFVELDVNTTVANQWETLTYNFTNLIDESASYTKVIVFFEFIADLPGDGSTYYYDNIETAMVEDPGSGVSLPVDFESTELTYMLEGFEGADSAVETNPDQTGENTSATVVRTIKTQDAAFFAGTTLELDTPIDFSTNEGISIQTWSPKAGIPVRIKVEAANADIFAEVDVNTTVANQWETLTFDFSNSINPNNNYIKVIVFFEFVADLPGDGSTYYYDNIETVDVSGGGANDVGLPVDFESTELTYVITGFEGADSAIETNPDQTGENTSATVVRTIKTQDAAFFAGTTLELDTPIDFSTDKGISIQTWSPKADIPVRIKLETADPALFAEVDVNTTVASAWETLTYDFTGLVDPNLNYTKIIVFFEFVADLPGDGSTYYYDNIETVEITDTGDFVALPLTFEEMITYDFTGFEGADSAIEANPDQSGENTSATVMRTTKTQDAAFFAGTTVELSEAVDFSSSGKIFIQTWSPKAGIPVRLKLEGVTNDIFVELDANTTVASAWETLEYDFSGVLDADASYVKVIVFFEFVVDLAGDGTTYYFDNVSVGSPVSVNQLTAEQVQVFPNPATDRWSITSPEATIDQVNLFDVTGKRVLQATPRAFSYDVPAAQLPAGTYFLRVNTAEGFRVVRLLKM